LGGESGIGLMEIAMRQSMEGLSARVMADPVPLNHESADAASSSVFCGPARHTDQGNGSLPSVAMFVLATLSFAFVTALATHLAKIREPDAQLWLGPGLLAGLFLVSSRRCWLGYAVIYPLASGAVYLLSGYSPGSTSIRTAIATMEAVAIGLLLHGYRDWVEGRADDTTSWLRFVGVALLLVPAAAALVGGALLHLERGLGYSEGFRIWYTAHATSMCVMVPVILRLRGRQLRRLADKKLLGVAVAMLTLFGLAAFVVFTQSAALPLFLLMPFLVAILFFVGFPGLVAALGLLALLATATLHTGMGPFLTMAPGRAWWSAGSLAQVFIMLVFGTMGLIAALLEERRVHEAELEAANAELRLLVATDPLTGVANRRRFDDELATRWRQARSSGSALALLVVDVDYFKLFNDIYGHSAGDACLRRIASLLQRETRRSDSICARYGGEEFVILLPETTADEAMVVGSRLCTAIRNAALTHAGSAFGVVTVSIGASAVMPIGDEDGRLFRQSDEALYHAKLLGRSRAECFL
jgi:diguanylate cyclase (GGDEF)-like protein